MKDFARLFGLYLVFGALMVNGIIKFKEIEYTTENIGNGAFLVGSLFLFIGIIRYLKGNNFLTLVIYSYKKLFEIVKAKDYSKNTSKLKDYHDYLENRKVKEEPYGAIVVNGLLFCAFAVILVWKSF